jgi:hypothetical protein
VGNKRKGSQIHPLPGEVAISVDRSNPVLGNQHVLSTPSDRAARNLACDRFDADLAADLARNGPMARAVADIAAQILAGGRVILMCWCEPKRCHGRAIAAAVRARIRHQAPDHPAGKPDTVEDLDLGF